MKRLNEKIDWIRSWQAQNSPEGVDILNTAFGDDYYERFDPNGSKSLGRVLSFAYKAGECDRWISKLGGNTQMGFPSWVYVYDFSKPIWIQSNNPSPKPT